MTKDSKPRNTAGRIPMIIGLLLIAAALLLIAFNRMDDHLAQDALGVVEAGECDLLEMPVRVRLYGKLPLRYRKDTNSFHLSNIYLYSVPGETGRLRMYDSKPILDNLAMGGVPQETCANLSKALTDLAYDVLKVSLHPEPNGGLALSLKIAGKSTHNNVTVPVNLEVTFHGDLEQLLNTGFRTFNR